MGGCTSLSSGLRPTGKVRAVTTFGYDANGRQTSSTNGSNVTAYTYDVRNNMVGMSVNGVAQAAYVYDDDGNRVQETAGGVTTDYLTDTNNPTGYDQPLEEKSSSTSAPARRM